MGKFSENIELKKEAKEKDKVRREKLGCYFLNLSQLTFVAWCLGGLSPLLTSTDTSINWYVVIGGLTLTILFCIIGNKILK